MVFCIYQLAMASTIDSLSLSAGTEVIQAEQLFRPSNGQHYDLGLECHPDDGGLMTGVRADDIVRVGQIWLTML